MPSIDRTHLAAPPVDLSNCDREPIHILGAIQPFGFLIALTQDWLIARVSRNIGEYLGMEPAALLGQPVTRAFCDDAIHAIRNRLALLHGPDSMERLFALPLVAGGPPFDVAVHFSGATVVIEAEPASTETIEAASLVRNMVARLDHTDTMAAFFREGARQVRALTAFDRVMVYRFDREGAGEVVAEAARPGVDSFLGLNYPASDIPKQARTLYLRNRFRIIADVAAEPAPIVPVLDPLAQPLDLSLSILRAVSPIHLEYLTNMGVEASLSISIVCEGRLWGLFACHHYAPRCPSFAARSAAELFGQMFSMQLESRERREAADYEVRARSVADRLMTAVAQESTLLHDAQWLGDVVFGTIPADGVGVFIDGVTALSGLTPDRARFEELVRTLNRLAASRVFVTERIGDIVEGADAYADRAAGLIAIPLSRSPRDYVVLFRAERLRSVRWAGNPQKAVKFGPNGGRLTPRKSFEAWSELVRGRSAPFTEAERRVAETLRVALLEVVLRLADSAGEERRRAQERQELLIAELNHRVRNILALIRGLISQTRESAVTPENFVETLDRRVQALARAHDQITSDRWGPARLRDLIEIEAGAFLGEKRSRIQAIGASVLIQPTAFTTLALVFHELITNAAKYGALTESGSVEIRWEIRTDGALELHWRERGGPAVTAPIRRGFGSTIIERSVPYDLGGEAEIRYHLAGLEARFVLPAASVAGIDREEPGRPGPAKQQPVARPLAGKSVLLVEDSMIIALNCEDALRTLGAREVQTAASAARALQLVEEGGIEIGLLDFNLGRETSVPVADRLKALGIPYVFATGYGDELDLPPGHANAVIVKKPYDVGTLGGAFTAPSGA